MDRLRDAARAAGAAAVLTVLLVGVPTALVVAVGWPLPTALPDLTEVRRALTGGTIGDGTVVKAIAVVVWLAWMQVALAAGAEAWSLGRRQTARPVPLTLPGVQLLVGQLLSTALLLSVALQPRSTAVGPLRLAVAGVAPEAVERPMAPAAESEAARTWTVQPRETLWGIAERTLGDGRRFDEIAALNRGRLQPDGATFESPQTIRPGWVLQLPGDAAVPPGDPTHVVAPGESLSGVARDRLGDLHRWPELWELNRGRPQPDGDMLEEPDLIRPGWVLRLPAEPAPAPVVASPEPASREPDSQEPESHATGAPAVAAPAPLPAEQAQRKPQEETGEETGRAPLSLLAAGAGLAGLVVALERRRRVAWRHRRRSGSPSIPRREVQLAERQLRAAARPSRAAAVEAALRSLAGSPSVASVQRVEVDDEGVRLYLDGPADLPGAFTRTPDGGWCAPLDLEELARLPDGSSPMPALATVGHRGDADVLVDLEQTGTVTVSGPDDDVHALLAAMAVDLDGAPWADGVTVLRVGMHGAAATWDEAAAAVGEHVVAVRRRLEQCGALTVDHARRAGIEGLDPLVVVGMSPPERLLDDLRRGAGVAAAVVLGGVPPLGGIDLSVDGGVLAGVPGGPDGIAPAGIGRAAFELLDELLAPAATGVGEDGDELLDPPLSEPLVLPAAAVPVLPTAPALLAELDVLVRLFGPLGAVRLDGNLEHPLHLPRQKALEVVAYLACRDRSVPVEDVRDALWPSGATSLKTLQNVVTDARSILGAARDGEPLLPLPEAGTYHLSRRVGTDADLFRALAREAAQLPDERAGDVAELLEEALGLVAGEPFVGAARGYAWVSHQRGALVAEVVDAAEELAEIRLAEGDWRGAEWAARQGLRAFPCDERLYRLLMRAAHAAGNAAGVQRVFDELCDVVADPELGVEPEDTVHPETLALLEELAAPRQSRAIGA